MDVTLDSAFAAIIERSKREKIAFVALDYAQQLANIESDSKRYLAVGQVAHRAIEIARECDCHVVITSQVNVAQDGARKRYSFRESAILEQKANNALLFLVEWDAETRRVVSAEFLTTKIRDGAQFRLRVRYDARVFQVSDEAELRDNVVEIQDWANR
jgi:replicative DNA helicase